ncbi:High-affinity branched-chain amino acid transport system permease protein LivH [bacterium HR16]|nr:High-affinity branched-chain amino acid transport system permease protein LivH [bacterium HR16]
MEVYLQQLINGVQYGSIYALIAVGYTMVYGVLRLINFAHGDIYMLGAFVAYYVVTGLALHQHPSVGNFLFVLIVSMAVCALAGVLIERLAYRPIRNAPRLTALITAIGVSLLLENGGIVVFGADPKYIPTVLQSSVAPRGGLYISEGQVIMLAASVLFMLILRFIVMSTRFGRAVRAISYDIDAARLMGIDVDRAITLTFALGSALAGAAGMMVATFTSVKITPLFGLLPGVKAFVAAVLGGIGNIPGAVLGGILMGIIEAFVGGSALTTYRDAIAFMILIIVLLLRPGGILGKAVVEKV